jgi:hypothetical protein
MIVACRLASVERSGSPALALDSFGATIEHCPELYGYRRKLGLVRRSKEAQAARNRYSVSRRDDP